jgi:flagellar basal body-associated protein FliL
MAKKILIVLGALAVLAGAGFAVRRYLKHRKPLQGARNAKPAPVKVDYVDVKEMTLRLADPDAEHYIRLEPILAVLPSAAEEVKRTVPVVRDRIVTIVTACSSAQLSTPSGANQLRQEMLDALRKRFGKEVVAVYFSEYLVE